MFNGRMLISGYRAGGLNTTFFKTVGSCANAPAGPLSACQTAAGNERSVLRLAGVAIRSGVKSTLGSLWFVSDEGTVPLITDFYLNLKQGMSKAEALQQAQIQQINTSNHHPSIWSSFILIGSWL
jgi:CHAT domain-containing protein